MGGRSKTATAALERYFKGLPVVDATKALTIVATAEDVSQAVPGDPGNCALACAARRSFGSTAAVFFRTCAYIDLVDEDGKRRVHRYVYGSSQTRDLIIVFDVAGKFPPGGFRLKAPKRTQTLEGRRQAFHEQQRAKLLGTAKEVPARGKQSKRRDPLLEYDVRSGAGMVHFTRVDS